MSTPETPKIAIQWAERKVPVSALKPYERNPRRLSEAAAAKLKASILEMGYHQRIIAQPDLRVIGGHMRIKILKELGINEITVLVPDRELTEAEFKRLLIQDNLPFGEFDWPLLQTDFAFQDLKEWGLPADWLAKARVKYNDEEADRVPELPAKATSRPGDIWLLGKHRVLCGDSTKREDVEALLRAARPNLMVTDPPYGVEYDADWRNRVQRADGSMVAARAIGVVHNDDRDDWRDAWALFPGNIAYVWHAGLSAGVVAESLESQGFKLRAQIIWAKSNFAIGRGDYHWKHEPCLYAVREKGDWHGDRSQTTLWDIDKPQKSETGHSTQKPIECMRRPMLNNAGESAMVLKYHLNMST